MGFIINREDLKKTINIYKNYAVISCLGIDKTMEIFHNYLNIQLGEQLSAKLIEYSMESRSYKVTYELDKIIRENENNNILINSINILFNPSYKLDVLKYVSNLARVKKVVVVWNGTYTKDKLIFSEPKYTDYREFNIKDYDIICLI